MSAIKANWHLPPVADADEDPFAAPIESVGVPIRLDADRAELNREFVALVRREQELANDGTRCAIKDADQTSCHVCPVAGRHGELCTIGRQQETALTLMAVLEHG